MRPVICFGEALIDFLYTDQLQQGLLSLPSFRQYPGGAPANAAVAVAKLGGKAYFAGQVGADLFGDFLADAMRSYGVDIRFLARHPRAQTALAFVMLDEQGERGFSFYRDNSADLLFDKKQVKPDWFQGRPILHFCSNTLTTGEMADCTQYIVAEARKQDCIISFDVNLRHNLWQRGYADRQRVNTLVTQADIVKFSREEFTYLAADSAEQYLANCLQEQCKLIVITDGANPIEYHGKSLHGVISPPKVTVVDTTAGGDAFIGGLLYTLSQLAEPLVSLADKATLEALLRFAATCGAHAVSQPGAFPALPDRLTVMAALAAKGKDRPLITQLLDP